MAATFEYDESNGTASGSPATGSITHGVTQVNWKNADDATVTAYNAAPITAGDNSFDKWQFGHFSGTYNTILDGLWAHTAGVLGTGLTLMGKVAPDGNTYTTPATTENTELDVDMTEVIAIGSGQAVLFGATSPQAGSKGTSTTANPAYTEWLATQLLTEVTAAPGDTATVTLTLQYNEN